MTIENFKVKFHKDGTICVEDEERSETMVKANVIDSMTSMSDVTDEQAAILLATIENARVTSNDDCSTISYEEMDDDDICKGLIKLLDVYEVDEVIELLEDMKYFEIRETLESVDPVAAVREIEIMYDED